MGSGGERVIKFFEKYKKKVERNSLRQFYLRNRDIKFNSLLKKLEINCVIRKSNKIIITIHKLFINKLICLGDGVWQGKKA